MPGGITGIMCDGLLDVSVVCVSVVVLLLSDDRIGSRSSRFKRPITVRISGIIVVKLPCIDFTVSVICNAVFATCSDSPS